jgi:hypothetical protein
MAAIASALELDELDAAVETGARERTEVLLQERLELVLRQACRRGRAHERRLLSRGKAHLDRLSVVGGRERRAGPRPPHDVDRSLPRSLLEPPAAE